MASEHDNTHSPHHNGAARPAAPFPGADTTPASLMQQAPPDVAKVWEQRAYALAEPPAAPADGETLDVLVFMVGGERYGIDVQYVVKIYARERLTAVPRTPPFVVGVFSARGRIISVIDLRLFFGLPNADKGEDEKILVVADEQMGMEVGFLADSVTDVVQVFADDLEPALMADVGSRARFTQGITPDMMVVLNAHALLADERLVIQEELT